MITFNTFILLGFSLRILFLIIGTYYTVKIIGFNNMEFLAKYIKRSFFSLQKLFYWIIAFLSIVYFEYLVSNAKGVSFSDVYNKNWFLTILVVVLLLGNVLYAYYDAKDSIANAKETKKDLSLAKTGKKLLRGVAIVSSFIPVAIIVKGGISLLSFLGSSKIDNMIAKKVSTEIIKTLEIMLIIAVVNLSIILISTYLITDQIIFW